MPDLENLRNRNEIRKFYQKLKGQIQDFKASNIAIFYSKSGTLITNPDDTNCWVEYFNHLLNGNIKISPNLPVFHSTASSEAADGMTVHPTYQEVTLDIKRFKNNKIPGSDDILAEYLKAGGDVLAQHLHIVLQ